MNIELKDNCCEKLSRDNINCLVPLTGNIKNIVEKHPNLLIFPQCLGMNNDGIENNYIFRIEGNSIRTGNLAGFIGIKGIDINICSRFDTNAKQYFLHYLLQKVIGINLFNLPIGMGKESIWDWLTYLFPIFLRRALAQGIFRTYKNFAHNDDKVKGTIDFAEHIRHNIPFNGNIAYNTREYTTNNHVTQLIRHTIEFIKRKRETAFILQCNKETRDCITLINQLTPSYKPQELTNIIAKNLKPIRHPYYTQYFALQQLCLKILRNEKTTNDNNIEKIYGVLFDVAWLWEEYLAGILKPLGYKHLQNKVSEKHTPFKIYNKEYIHKALINAIPDFYYEERQIIADAKYKPLESEIIRREDRFQLISYLHITKYNQGIVIYPTTKSSCCYQEEGTLNGFSGHIGKIGIQIPQEADTFKIFCHTMQNSESIFCNSLITSELSNANA